MPDDNRVLVTVLLHHDQSKTLDEIMAHLRKTGFLTAIFPPDGSELVSWVVAMSYGFVITLRVEPDKLREPQPLHGGEGPGAPFVIRSSPPTTFAPHRGRASRRTTPPSPAFPRGSGLEK